MRPIDADELLELVCREKLDTRDAIIELVKTRPTIKLIHNENRLYLASGATPLTTADAIIRECSDEDWLRDTIYYLNCYIDRVCPKNTTRGDSE